MRLEKIRIEFEPEEDRLVMRILIDGQAEVLLWLTRRCVKRLWVAMLKMAEWKPEIQQQPDREARSAILQFEHEKALREVKFSRPEADAPTATPLPPREQLLGPTPLLVTRIQARRLENGRSQLALLPTQGQGAHLTLTDNLLHGLMRLTQSAVDKAEWDMRLELPKSALMSADVEGERTLN